MREGRELAVITVVELTRERGASSSDIEKL